MLLNMELLLTFVHTLLACVKDPNKLVLSVFETLSCKYTVAALASRSIMFVEFIAVVRFMTNRHLGRRDVHKFGKMAIKALREFLPSGEFIKSCRAFKDGPQWKAAFDKWAVEHVKYADLVRKSCDRFKDLWPLYLKPGCTAFADGLEKYLDADDTDDPEMEHAPVNTDFLESTFGTLDYLNNAGHGVDIWANFGQALALKTGIFVSYEKRVRILNSRRNTQGLPPLSGEAAFDVVSKSPMFLLEKMTNDEFEKVYMNCRKMTTPTFKNLRADKKLQLAADLDRKEQQVREQERREMRALQRFKDRENFEVFKTMEEILELFKAKHPTGSFKYTAVMKCEIVVAQLQYRRDCLNRVLPQGAMCSSHKGTPEAKLKDLLGNLKRCMKDEAKFFLPRSFFSFARFQRSFFSFCDLQARIPALLTPPTIRRKYNSHMFATTLRTELDRDRNAITKAMTEAFVAAYSGGKFKGWRCSVDYAMGHPLNPKALVGQRVSKDFEHYGLHHGTIISHQKWWKVQYDDGEQEDMNYKDLSVLAQPPNFDVLRYKPPPAAVEEFLERSNGSTTMAVPGVNNSVNTFRLEQQDWVFISVFLVPDSKVPIQGAYILEVEFEGPYRELTLRKLQAEYPTVRTSPMGDVNKWIEKSKELAKLVEP